MTYCHGMTNRHGIAARDMYNAMAGELVESARENAKLTQTELARRLGMTQPALSRKLSGARGWDIGELIEVASVLDVPITDLIPERRVGTSVRSLTQ